MIKSTSTIPMHVRAGDAEAATAAAILAWVFVHSTLRVPKSIGAMCALAAYGLAFRKRVLLPDQHQEALGLPLSAYLVLLILVRMGDLAWDGLSPRTTLALVASSCLMLIMSGIFASIWRQLRTRAHLRRSDEGLLLARFGLALAGTALLIRGQTILALALATSVALGDNAYATTAFNSEDGSNAQSLPHSERGIWAGLAAVVAILWFALRSGVLGSVSVFLR